MSLLFFLISRFYCIVSLLLVIELVLKMSLQVIFSLFILLLSKASLSLSSSSSSSFSSSNHIRSSQGSVRRLLSAHWLAKLPISCPLALQKTRRALQHHPPHKSSPHVDFCLRSPAALVGSCLGDSSDSRNSSIGGEFNERDARGSRQ